MYADDMLIWAKGDGRTAKFETARRLTEALDDDKCHIKLNPGKEHVFSTAEDDQQLKATLDLSDQSKQALFISALTAPLSQKQAQEIELLLLATRASRKQTKG